MAGILFAYSKNKKAKVKTIGKTFNLLILLVPISKLLAEKISKEKGVSMSEAENIVTDCIREGMKTVKTSC